VARRLVGVDLSAPMLAKARERGFYDELVELELTAFLEQRPGAFDLLVSGDTLVYLGDLEPVFAAASQSLRGRGALIFSVERPMGEFSAGRFQLNRFGRYVHETAYVHQALSDASFAVLASREEVLRLEAGDPVPGLVVAARKR
jgi:predicted TPR repeat methyltransferase